MTTVDIELYRKPVWRGPVSLVYIVSTLTGQIQTALSTRCNNLTSSWATSAEHFQDNTNEASPLNHRLDHRDVDEGDGEYVSTHVPMLCTTGVSKIAVSIVHVMGTCIAIEEGPNAEKQLLCP